MRFAIHIAGALAACAATGCVAGPATYANHAPADLSTREVLVLGRVRVFLGDDEATRRSGLRTNDGGAIDYELDTGGMVSWRRSLPLGDPAILRTLWVAGYNGGSIRLGAAAPVLVPEDPDASVVYFGDVRIRLTGGVPSLLAEVDDNRSHVLSTLVRQNPALRGVNYWHVLRGSVMSIP